MISKDTLLSALSFFKNEADNTYILKNSYETVTEDDLDALFIEIGTFSYTGSKEGSSEFEVGMTW